MIILNVITLNVVLLHVITLNVVMLCVIMLIVLMISGFLMSSFFISHYTIVFRVRVDLVIAIILTVNILNVVAPNFICFLWEMHFVLLVDLVSNEPKLFRQKELFQN